MMSEQTRPRAFAVWFKDLARWDPNSFHDVSWHWPTEVMKPLGSVLKIRKEKVNRMNFAFADLQPITIHFDGSLDKRKVDPTRAYTMDLYFACPGDIVVAKIDLKNGAVGRVPDGWENAVVTGHFAVYEPDLTQVVPEYLLRLIQTRFFKAHLNRNKVGAEGRKEVKLSFFEAEPIPLPPLPVQQAIVARWEAAQAEVSALRKRFVDIEGVTNRIVLDCLGIPAQEFKALPKAFALPWKDVERWSVGYVRRDLQGASGFTKAKYPVVPLSTCLAGTSNGYSIKPVANITPYKMLKLNALTVAGLDPTLSKYVDVPEVIAARYSLHKGDLLLCRSVGSFSHIAKCALVEEDHAEILYPDIIIRARFNGTVLPEYVREVIQTKLGRAYFQSNARTSVGMWKIGAEDIRNFPLPLPPLDVQREIVEKVQAQRQEMARLRELAERKTREIKADVEAMILGAKPVEMPTN